MERRGTIENQSMIIFLNEEGNVAELILLIRLSIPPKRPNPESRSSEGQTGRDQARDVHTPHTRSSPTPLLLSLHLDTIRLTEGRLHHQVTALCSLFAYKPVTINDHWSDVSRAL